MAVIKSINLLPEVFRSDVNQKFLAATVDQLTSEPDLVKIDGFIGRTFAPTYKYGDSYIAEPTRPRQNYQLETSFVVQDNNGNPTFYSSYLDLIEKINYYGGLANNHSRLFENESYNFNGLIDLDKFVNFNQYLWMPDGPPEVVVSAATTLSTLNFTVTRDTALQAFTVSGYDAYPNPIITLIRGETYTFNVNQPGHPFWIQTQPGPTGTYSIENEELHRTILGVSNNGDDVGTITFQVPASTAQDDLLFAPRVAEVDYTCSLTYAQVHNHLLTVIKKQGGFDGAASVALNGATVIFLNKTQNAADWTGLGIFDFDRFDQDAPYLESDYDGGITVPAEERFDIFRIRIDLVGGNNGVVRVEHVQTVGHNQKVYIKGGQVNSGVEYVKSPEGYWEPVAPITATLNELYYQIGDSSIFGGTIRLIDAGQGSIDVNADIIGKTNYTSPNGVKFTNGMKIRFDNTATPVSYTNNLYIIEGVGRSIRLVNVGNLVTPESYAIADSLTTKDYITISRGSQDLNAWSRSNRWFHVELIELAASYNKNPLLLNYAVENNLTPAQRPIIEFEPDISLFNYGQVAKAPVDILDYTVTDAFNQVEGTEKYVIHLPNNVTKSLTAGTRIIFAGDTDPDVRSRIYKVDFITTEQKTQIHLVSQNTDLLPTYYVSGAQLVEDVNVVFIGGNPDTIAEARATVDFATGVITDVEITNPGKNYRSIPTVAFVGGGGGYGAQLDFTLSGGTVGYISSYRLSSGGSGYSTSPVYGYIPTVTFTSPVPSISAKTATGTAVMSPTTVANITVTNGGLNYIADPYLEITTQYTQPVSVESIYRNFKHVDYVRIINGGSIGSTTTTLTFSSPNALEAYENVTANAAPFTDVTVTLNSVTGLSVGQIVFGQGISGGTTIAGVNAVTSEITLSAPVEMQSGRKLVFKDIYQDTITATQTYSNTNSFTGTVAKIGSVSGVQLNAQVSGIGITPGTVVSAISAVRNEITLSQSAILQHNVQLFIKTSNTTGTETYSNTSQFSDSIVNLASVVGIGNSWEVYGEGVSTGTYITAINISTNQITLNQPAYLKNNRTLIFKIPNKKTVVTLSTVRFSNILKVDNTKILAPNMYVTGGAVPYTITNITQDSPAIVTLSSDHLLVSGDQIRIRAVGGMIGINTGLPYYVVPVAGSTTKLAIYADSQLQSPLDTRSFDAYTGGGKLTGYSIDYGVIVTKIIDDFTIQLSDLVSLRAGTTLAFVGKTAQATARVNKITYQGAQQNKIYAITITDPGSGYTTSPTLSATYTDIAPVLQPVLNDNILEYFKIVYSGSGYKLASQITTNIRTSVEAVISAPTTYGDTVLTFDATTELNYLKSGWNAFLVVEQGAQFTYTDFSRVPYASTETTGPNDVGYLTYMDVALTTATVRKVLSVDYTSVDGKVLVTLGGSINSLDADGEQINLPTGSKIYFTCKSRWFTEDGLGNSNPLGDTRSNYITQLPVFNSPTVKLNSVLGIQYNMDVKDLSGTLPTGLKVLYIDPVDNTVVLNQTLVSAPSGLPLQFDFSASAITNLASTKVALITVDNGGAEYTSAPSITVSPAIPQVEKLATSVGTDTIEVPDLNGIVIGMTVTSEYTVSGSGVTTGAQIPRVINTQIVQTGTATFRYFVQLNYIQPAFQSILVFFSLAAKALAQIKSLNIIETATNTLLPDSYEAGNTVLLSQPTAGQSALFQVRNKVSNLFNQYWFDGSNWLPAQQKTQYNQPPLFDVYDINRISASNTKVYQGSKFLGTPLFAYKVNSIYKKDTQLGFSPSYANFTNVGDLEFTNHFDTDTITYLKNNIEVTLPINRFYLKQKTLTGDKLRNIWKKVKESTKQYQIISQQFDGITNYFIIDILPSSSKTVPYLKVYVDNVLLNETQYHITQYRAVMAVVVDPTLLNAAVPNKVDILIYNQNAISNAGYYQLPINIDTNTENKNFTTLTLGQMRHHLAVMTENHYGMTGTVLGKNNLRDLNTSEWTGSILQHASPGMYSAAFLGDNGLEFVDAIEYAQREYTKFKTRFISQCLKEPGVSVKDIPGSVDLIMQSIMIGKNSSMPWYDSDMVPYGTAYTSTTLLISDVRKRRYQLPTLFDDTVLSRRSVLVYLVDNSVAPATKQQLLKGIDFSFNATLGVIDIADSVTLTYASALQIIDRPNTTGNYVPETPTKLGLYPKFEPKIFVDNTYQTPTKVIQGHDGSILPAYNDIRDQLILELETRIFNNLKTDYKETLIDIFDSLPGKYRNSNYSKTEFNQLLTRNFLKWTGSNQVDYIGNNTFSSSNAWTWNYRTLKDISGEFLPGFWRGIYQYFYDTDRPHLAPWEMLGFYEMPDWWQDLYGPAPYSGANKVLWDDLEAGYIAGGPRQGYDERFARPGLSRVIPVDENGLLKSPEKVVVGSFDSDNLDATWAIGDIGPVESAWRRSSEYPFALQIAIALSRPGFYFGACFDSKLYQRNIELDQLEIITNNQRVTKETFSIPDNGLTSGTVNLTAGYINWVRDWFSSKAINGTTKIESIIRNLQVKLSYRMAGYTDSRLLTVLADQSSPISGSSSIVVPQESYKIFLSKTAPVSRIVYSGVIVTKTTSGYSVSGYSNDQPYFTIIPSTVNANNFTITALNETGVIYRDFQNLKLIVPYGYEFQTRQQVVDFLISYGRFLIGQGMIFDTYSADLEARQDWVLSAREFLTWSQQGWNTGGIIILSPVFNSIKIENNLGIVDQIQNIRTGSKLLDQDFNIIKSNQLTVLRDENTFTVTGIFGQIICLADFNLIQYEHVLLLDNKTVFNDIIYQPELGNRQYRIKLIGSRTGSWSGQLNPGGYIYNNEIIDAWQSAKNYRRGSLVSFKDNYYYATQEVPAATEFNFAYWNPIDKNRIKTGLLPNFASNAEKFNNIYDIDNIPADSQLEALSTGIIGFKNRDYFQDLKLSTTTQSKFYQGYIKQKGTVAAVNALTKANFDNISGNISLYEEWGLRVGDYGALGSDQSIEIELDESRATNDPFTLVLRNLGDSTIDGLINVNPLSIYNYSEDKYNPNPILNRNDITPRLTDSIVAGYVRLDDIDATIFDIKDYQNHVDLVPKIGAGFKLWVAKDFNTSWNVYRAFETNVIIEKISIGLDNKVTVVTDVPHGVLANELFVIKGFDTKYDGIYQVLSVTNNTTFVTQGYRNLDKLKTQQNVTGNGILMYLRSVRFNYVSELVSTLPLHGWKSDDKIWVDNDTDKDIWAVFQKNNSWTFNRLLPVRTGGSQSNEGYGETIRSNLSNNWILAGAKNNNIGAISGLKVTNPGFLYDDVRVTISMYDQMSGKQALATIRTLSGNLLTARLSSVGSNYNQVPSVVITDQDTQVTASASAASTTIKLSSVYKTVTGLASQDAYQVANVTLATTTNIWVGDAVSGTDLSGNTISGVFVSNINYDTKSISLTGTISWNAADAQALSFTRQTVFADDLVTGSDGIYSIPEACFVRSITVSLSTIVVNVPVNISSGTTLTFSRGSGGIITPILTPTTVASISVLSGGSGFNSTPFVQISGGGGYGATATATVDGGAISSIVVTSGGAGYTGIPTVTIVSNDTNATVNAVVVQVLLTPTTVQSLEVTSTGGSYRTPVISFVNPSGAGVTGSGIAGTVNVTNRSLSQYYANVSIIEYGLGYSSTPTVTVKDAQGSGSGATVEAIYTTGIVKVFQVSSDTIQQVQSIVPFAATANEFGKEISVGEDYAFVSSPGFLANTGAVAVNRLVGSTWSTQQIIYPGGITSGDRFGDAVVTSQDQHWVYIGAPGQNTVYVYESKETPINQTKFIVKDGVTSFATNFVNIKNASQLRVVGNTGRIFEPVFDYSFTGGIITFVNYERISGEASIYVNQLYPTTSIVPVVYNKRTGYVQRDYTLKHTPSDLEQVSVVGSDGRVFVPRIDYTIFGDTIRFINIEFSTQATILITVLTKYYVPIRTLTPPDQISWVDTTYAREYSDTVTFPNLIRLTYDTQAQLDTNTASLRALAMVTVTDSYTITLQSVQGIQQGWQVTGSDDQGHTIAPGTTVTDINLASRTITFSSTITFRAGNYIRFNTPTILSNGVFIKVLNLQTDGTYGSYNIYRYENYVTTLLGTENRNVTRNVARFGSSLATTKTGQQVIIGAPYASGTAEGVTATAVGKAYIFDRSYQVFTGTGTNSVFTCSQNLLGVTTVLIDDIDITQNIDYIISGTKTIVFATPPRNGTKIKVDVNQFNLIQIIENPQPVKDGRFGYSVALTPTNTNIFIGAPGYKDVDYYNGRVYRFVNQALVYGEVVGTVSSPTTVLGDTVRINDVEVLLQKSNQVTTRIISDIATKNITGVAATTDGISGVVFIDGDVVTTRGLGYFSSNVGAIVDPPDQLNGYTATISSIGLFANGAIQTVTIGNVGSGYSYAPGITFIGGNTIAATATTSVDKSPIKIYSLTSAKVPSINILPGYGQALADIGINTYRLVQVLQHPELGQTEKYGRRVQVDNTTGETLLVASDGAATLKSTTFDKTTTTIDQNTTRLLDILINSGAVYVYDYLDVPGDTIGTPSQYLYNQVLQDANILAGDSFGSGFDIVNKTILVGAAGSNYYTPSGGLVHIFNNEKGKKGWSKLRTRNAVVDLDYLNQAFVYSKKDQTIQTQLDYFDPAKGKILGVVDQYIDYKTTYDPATYNKGNNSTITINEKAHWSELQVGRTWWNLGVCRYINYEQGDLNYRIANWGKLFPGSTVEVLEWVESLVLPSQYAATGGNGVAKYADDSAYVETQFVDNKSGFIMTKYYYWVKNKASVDVVKTNRTSSIVSLEKLIASPAEQDIPYLAVIADNAFSLYNVNSYLNSTDRVLKVEYAQTVNQHISHSEYELVQQGSPLSPIPTKLINKLIDSLSGENIIGEVVPDLRLRDNQKLGIGIRPRQTMIADSRKALRVLVNYLNGILIKELVTQLYDISGFMKREPYPDNTGGYYSQIVATLDQLFYISTAQLIDGYKVLVQSDSEYNGYWTIYEYKSGSSSPWTLTRIQSYDTTYYWEYADWYATGYSDQTTVNYIAANLLKLESSARVAGQVWKILDNGSGLFEIYVIDSNLQPVLVGAQHGTIQLTNNLWDSTLSQVGFDNGGFDTVGFAKTSAIELRNIIEALISAIFISTNAVEVNNMFFVMLNYILSEQKTIDWAIKTSFLSVVQKIRKLLRFPSYIKDQQGYYESYINEVKPYRSQLRNYLLSYEGIDTAGAATMDFDLPAFYDSNAGVIRPPVIANETDLAIINSTSSKTWLDNYKYSINSIRVTRGGTGYVTVPRVEIVGGGGTGATAVAEININPVSSPQSSGKGYTPDGSVAGAATTTNGTGTGMTVNYTVSGGVITVINIQNFGQGYVDGDIITIPGSNIRNAYFTFNTGKVINIVITNFGTGYTSRPLVNIIGGQGVGAQAYADLQQSGGTVGTFTKNRTIRGIKTHLNFDRITYNVGGVYKWRSYTTYHPGDIVAIPSVVKTVFSNLPDQTLPKYTSVYLVKKKILGSLTLDLNVFNDSTIVDKLSGIDITNSIDRIALYNQPGSPDIAYLFSSPDTQRLDPAGLNDQASSQGNEWNIVVHSKVVPDNHEYQYFAAGNRALVAFSKDGVTWTVFPLSEPLLQLRDACLFDGQTWIAVSNQATLLKFSNPSIVNNILVWTTEKEIVDQFRYSPSINNPSGQLQKSASQAVDFTSTTFIKSTRGSYVIAVANGSTVLVNPYTTGLDITKGWYSIRPQPSLYAIPVQYLKVYNKSFGDLKDISGERYLVSLSTSGNFVKSNSGNFMQHGVVIVAGVNGNMFITTYARIDDTLQGYAKNYNYDSGKSGNPDYPWIPLLVPSNVVGTGDNHSGEQINDIAISDLADNWIVAVGSAGTLLWNRFDTPIQEQTGTTALGSDVLGETVIDYGLNVFKNFRNFDSDNFVAPLTASALTNYNFSSVTWDGEKFVVVGEKSTILWGYPGSQDEVYLEIASANPNTSALIRSGASAVWGYCSTLKAQWPAFTNATSVTVTISASLLDKELTAPTPGVPTVGMKVTSGDLPTDAIVTGAVFNIDTNTWTVDFSFATASRSAATPLAPGVIHMSLDGATAITSLNVTVGVADLVGAPVVGMLADTGSTLPTASKITNVAYANSQWVITVSFNSTAVAASIIGLLVMSYQFVSTVPVGTKLTLQGTSAVPLTLTVSRAVTNVHSLKVYVTGYEEMLANYYAYGTLPVGTNWTVTGVGMPDGARVVNIGKFAKFTWQFGKGSGRDVNVSYQHTSVNRNNIEISKPLLKDILGAKDFVKIASSSTSQSNTLVLDNVLDLRKGYILTSGSVGYGNSVYITDVNSTSRVVILNAPVSVIVNEALIFTRPASVITFFDSTGTKIQLPVSQTLNAGTTTLSFDNVNTLAIGYTVQPDSDLGIDNETTVLKTVNYNIAGYLSHLAKDIPDLVPGTSYSGVKVTGQPYTNSATDILSLDTDITSSYTDNLLGTRPEDIVVDGGKFIDRYSSHAPQELVPGQVIDSLQMNVFTAKVVNGQPDFGNVVAYKIFTDYKLPTVYYRLPAANTTKLTANVRYDALEIAVDNIEALPDPNRSQNQPGSVWINAERINYFGRNVQRGVIYDLRRGASRTSIPVNHITGSLVTDASNAQEIDVDTVLTINNDLSVTNGQGDTATYQSSITTSVPQGTIWLNKQ